MDALHARIKTLTIIAQRVATTRDIRDLALDNILYIDIIHVFTRHISCPMYSAVENFQRENGENERRKKAIIEGTERLMLGG